MERTQEVIVQQEDTSFLEVRHLDCTDGSLMWLVAFGGVACWQQDDYQNSSSFIYMQSKV